MSPALSNDCEVDSEVKKPLLHDLFDLLGLPVSNTGLSLFTIWTSSNSTEENDDDPTRCFPVRYPKTRCKMGRETLALVDVCPEARNLVLVILIIFFLMK